METTKSDQAIANDVLHLGSPSKLSAEAIAKAVAHHNKNHSGKPAPGAAPKPAAGNKQMAKKSR
jgi:hypothetical protein